MTKYYKDKSKENKPVFVWIDFNGNLKGVYNEILDAQDDKEKSDCGGIIISTYPIKARERKTINFL